MSADVALIHEARSLTTGANVHEMRGLLAMYETAANEPNPASQRTAQLLERRLRAAVKLLRARRAQSFDRKMVTEK